MIKYLHPTRQKHVKDMTPEQRNDLANKITDAVNLLQHEFDLEPNFTLQGVEVVRCFLESCKILAINVGKYKPEPKFKFGDKVRHNGDVCVVVVADAYPDERGFIYKIVFENDKSNKLRKWDGNDPTVYAVLEQFLYPIT